MDILRNTSQLQNQALSLGGKAVPFLILAIHFSPPATLVISIIVALLWLASGQIRYTRLIAKQSPAVFYALLLLAVMALSVSYSSAPYAQALATLSKYRKLLLLLILLPFVISPQHREKFEQFLLAALIITLLVSFIGHFKSLSPALYRHLDLHRITHSLYIAFLGFYCMHKLSEKSRHTALWALLLALVLLNLFFISLGRTGQLAFLFLCGLFFLQTFSTRTALLMTFAIPVAFALFMFFSPTAERFWEGINNSIDFFNNDPDATNTSMGARLRFWSNALTIIGYSPWFGEGIGGFPYTFHHIFPHLSILTNPHNEYLLIASQLGLPGLFLFLTFLAAVIRQATRLPKSQRHLLQGVWLMLCVSCLFNSSIFDHAEGHWFLALIAFYSAPLITIPSCLASSSSPETNPNT